MFYGIPLDEESEIDSIFFGYRCTNSAIDTIKNIFIQRRTELPNFYKMVLDEKDIYNLNYVEIQ